MRCWLLGKGSARRLAATYKQTWQLLKGLVRSRKKVVSVRGWFVGERVAARRRCVVDCIDVISSRLVPWKVLGPTFAPLQTRSATIMFALHNKSQYSCSNPRRCSRTGVVRNGTFVLFLYSCPVFDIVERDDSKTVRQERTRIAATAAKRRTTLKKLTLSFWLALATPAFSLFRPLYRRRTKSGLMFRSRPVRRFVLLQSASNE